MSEPLQQPGPEHAVLKPLADVLQECSQVKRTGGLFVSVAGRSDHLIRFYFEKGAIRNLSYGPITDRECYDIIDRCDFETVVYLDGMKTTIVSENLPSTDEIIEAMRACGKLVRIS